MRALCCVDTLRDVGADAAAALRRRCRPGRASSCVRGGRALFRACGCCVAALRVVGRLEAIVLVYLKLERAVPIGGRIVLGVDAQNERRLAGVEGEPTLRKVLELARDRLPVGDLIDLLRLGGDRIWKEEECIVEEALLLWADILIRSERESGDGERDRLGHSDVEVGEYRQSEQHLVRREHLQAGHQRRIVLHDHRVPALALVLI